MAEPTQPGERMLVGHFIVSDDVERSRRFYTEVLGGRVVFGPVPTNVELANIFIVINGGGAPPTTSPRSPLRRHATPTGSAASSISGSQTSTPYTPNGAPRGAQFLTPPKQHDYEIRCYIRDPDGYIIEVGQTTDPQGDWWPADWPAINPGGQSD